MRLPGLIALILVCLVVLLSACGKSDYVTAENFNRARMQCEPASTLVKAGQESVCIRPAHRRCAERGVEVTAFCANQTIIKGTYPE